MAVWMKIQEQASHHAGDTDVSCRWLLSCMGAFIGMLILWIRSLLKENKEESNARIADLKDQAKPFKRDKHGRQEESTDV